MAFGRMERDGRGRLCYLPAIPTFPKLDDVWGPLHRAGRLVEELDRAIGLFPLPGIFPRLLLPLEITHSFGCEGRSMGLERVLLPRRSPAADTIMASGLLSAWLDLSLTDGSDGAERDVGECVRRLHRGLYEQSPDDTLRTAAGVSKEQPNGIYDPQAPNGVFYFTSPAAAGRAVQVWEAFTAEHDDRPELMRQALSHWMFNQIQPMAEGNGPVGRAVVSLCLQQKAGLIHPCAFLSEALNGNRALYAEAVRAPRDDGDFAPWTRVFCTLLADGAKANLDRLDGLNRLYQDWLAAVRHVRSHSAVHRLVPWIFTHPVFMAQDALAGIGGETTFQALNTALARLVDLGMLAPAEGRRHRVFRAEPVLAVLTARR